jgi:hypothetical protein
LQEFFGERDGVDKEKLFVSRDETKATKLGQLDPMADAYLKSRVLLIDNGVGGGEEVARYYFEIKQSRTRRDFILARTGLRGEETKSNYKNCCF